MTESPPGDSGSPKYSSKGLSGIFEAVNLSDEYKSIAPSKGGAAGDGDEMISAGQLLREGLEMRAKLTDAFSRFLRASVDELPEMIEEGLAILGEAAEIQLPENTDFASLREALLKAYFELDQSIKRARKQLESAEPAALPPPKLAPPVTKKQAAASVRPVSDLEEHVAERKRSRRKLVILAIVLAVGGLGRLGFYLSVERGVDKPKLEHQAPAAGQKATETAIRRSPGVEISKGVPVVTDVRLSLAEDGLRAKAVALDLDTPKLTLTYRWFKNGEMIHEGSVGHLGEVEQFATYKVSVTASDGAQTSAPLESQPLVVSTKPKGQPSGS